MSSRSLPPPSRPRQSRRVDTIALVDRFDSGRRRHWVAAATLVAVAVGVAGWGLGARGAPPPREAKAPAPKSASSAVPSTTAASRARPPGGGSCELDRCAELPFPDPATIDPDALFAEATRQARLVDGAAQLGGAILQNVFTNGAVNLTREGAVVRLTFDLPTGGLQVDATRAGITVARFSRAYMDAVSPDVPCPPKRSLDVVVNRGFPITSETRATLTVGSLAGRSRWSFRTGSASVVVEGPTCALRDLSLER